MVSAYTRRARIALAIGPQTARIRRALCAAVLLFLGLAGAVRPAGAQIPGALNATLTASPNPALVGAPVSFSYSARPPAVAPPFPSITGVTVNYGDGVSDSGNTGSSGQPASGSLTHVYTAPGTYTARLVATSSNGESGSASANVTVIDGSSALGGSWLDSPLTNWNFAGMAVPPPPPVNQSGNDAFCNGQVRPPENANDRAITGAGWRLFGSYQGGWGIYIAGGQSDEDGMCRPNEYNFFVFVNGTFAGTLSPITMDSRTDGSLAQVYIDSGGGTLRGEFVRYTASDPLCCPSSTTEVSYHIAMQSGSPVVVPDSAYTSPNS